MAYGNIPSRDTSSNFKIAFKTGADCKNWNYWDEKLETSKSQPQVEEKRYADVFQHGQKFSSVKICDDLQYTLQFYLYIFFHSNAKKAQILYTRAKKKTL